MWIGRAAVLAVCAAVTTVFFINFCSLLYGCGCTFLWSGAAAHCNIHAATGRHCPWCVAGEATQRGIYLSMVATQALIVFWPLPWGWGRRLVLGLLAFPAVGTVIGLVMGLVQGYWN